MYRETGFAQDLPSGIACRKTSGALDGESGESDSSSDATQKSLPGASATVNGG